MKDGRGVTSGLLVHKTGMEDALRGQINMIQRCDQTQSQKAI